MNYRLHLLDRDPFTNRPAWIAILRSIKPRPWTVCAPSFKTQAARDTWVAWARKRYQIEEAAR